VWTLNDSLDDSGHFLPVVVELAQQDSVLRAGLDEAVLDDLFAAQHFIEPLPHRKR
jgi:hypothetical protein